MYPTSEETLKSGLIVDGNGVLVVNDDDGIIEVDAPVAEVPVTVDGAEVVADVPVTLDPTTIEVLPTNE